MENRSLSVNPKTRAIAEEPVRFESAVAGKYFTLGGTAGTEVRPATLHEWAAFFEDDSRRRVAFDRVTSGVVVSTVFLGLDHNFGKPADGPLVFETMVFGGPFDGAMFRYCRFDDALRGHEGVLAYVRASLWQRLRKRRRATARLQERARIRGPMTSERTAA